jgi:hypothetical protein
MWRVLELMMCVLFTLNFKLYVCATETLNLCDSSEGCSLEAHGSCSQLRETSASKSLMLVFDARHFSARLWRSSLKFKSAASGGLVGIISLVFPFRQSQPQI